MKNLKKILFVALTLALVIAFAPTAAQAATKTVKLNKKTLNVYAGGSVQLKMTGTVKSGKWTSSKKNVATVNSKGVVTAKKAGTTVITVKSGNKKAVCKVTVKKALSAKKIVGKVNKQLKNTKNLMAYIYAGKVSSKNIMMTIGLNRTNDIMYIDATPMGSIKGYVVGEKLYWQDSTTKTWYYMNMDGITITDGDITDLITSGYSLGGYTTFNKQRCVKINVKSEDGNQTFYVNAADYTLVGAEADGETLVVNFNKVIKLPKAALKATEKEVDLG